tara:strand:+ start:4233 stop:6197 length:1965 start_codon:yes stop_codon:yes gene_type:complete
MANIRKQFNFRNGVQVDDDKLIVSPTGLVGIGTSVPTEALDVRGNAKIVGFATFSSASTSSLTAVDSTLTTVNLVDSIIGSGISIRSGVITDTGSGIVTYYGDARYLQGMPGSQWIDIDVGLGYTSIYAQGNVGVGTVDPRFTFQVGGNNIATPAGFFRGVGIGSEGDVFITGITTSGTFVGVGSDITGLTGDNIAYGTISLDRFPLIPDSKLEDGQSLGIVTTTVLDATGAEVGVATITDLTVEGTLVGTASTAQGLTGVPDIIVGVLTATNVAASNFVGGITGDVAGTASTARSLTQDAVVDIDNLQVGLATVTGTLISNGSVGIGTDAPSVDLEIRNAGNLEVRLLGDGSSTIGLGKSDNILGANAAITFGNDSGLYDYSKDNALDILNNAGGNFNYYLQAGNFVGVNTGSFHWHKGINNRLMSLTYEGKLGIGVTEPIHEMHVVGTSTVTNDLFVGNGLDVFGDSVFQQDLTVNGAFTAGTVNLDEIVGNLTGDVNSTGINTVATLAANNFVGVGTDRSPNYQIVPERFGVNTPGPAHVFVDATGNIGIKTTNIYNQGITAPTTDVTIASVGIGTTTPRCAVDFSSANNNAMLGPNRDTVAYILPPRLTTSERNNLTNTFNTGLEEGAMIYNMSTHKLQVFDGTTWQDCF